MTARERIGNGARVAGQRARRVRQDVDPFVEQLADLVRQVAERCAARAHTAVGTDPMSPRHRPLATTVRGAAGQAVRRRVERHVPVVGKARRARRSLLLWRANPAAAAVRTLVLRPARTLTTAVVAVALVLWLLWTLVVPGGLKGPLKWAGGRIIGSSYSCGPTVEPVGGTATVGWQAGHALRSLSSFEPTPAQVSHVLDDLASGAGHLVAWFRASLAGVAEPTRTVPPTGAMTTLTAACEQGPDRGQGDVDAFMTALSDQESSGSYSAVNGRTGAVGRFQVLPANWPTWAAEAGLPGARMTQENQDVVVRHKLEQYRVEFGSWEAVAVAWYAGPAAVAGYLGDPTGARYTRPPAPGEPSVVEYVREVLARMPTSSSSATVEAAVAFALQQQGKPYSWGAAPMQPGGPVPSTFDCSSLVQSALAAAGVTLPGRQTTYSLVTLGQPVVGPPQRGDLVFPDAGHVGIALGDGRFVHAPHTGDVVKVSPVGRLWQVRRLVVGGSRPA